MLALIDARMGRRPSGIGQYLLHLCAQFGESADGDVRPIVTLRHYQRMRGLGLRPILRRRELRRLPSAQVFHGPNFHAPEDAAGAAVTTIHDLGYLTLPDHHPPGMSERLDALVRSSIAWTERFICVSEDTKRDFVSTYEVDPGRCDVIPHGVDTSRFAPRSADAVAAVRRRLTGGRPYALFVGAMVPRKNVNGLVQAFAELMPRAPDLQLVLAGHKTRRWASDWPGVKQRLDADPQLAERVKVLNYVGDADLPNLYAAAETVVLPSFTEGFGMTILEAFASGVPIVASNAGAIPEVGRDVAYYCDPHEPSSIAAAIEDVLVDASRAGRIARGLEIAREYAWRRSAELTLATYRRAAG